MEFLDLDHHMAVIEFSMISVHTIMVRSVIKPMF